jgi:ABC-type multidrug transport system permease subunit
MIAIFFKSLQFTLVEVPWALQNLTTARVVTAYVCLVERSFLGFSTAGKITVFVVDIYTDQIMFRVIRFLCVIIRTLNVLP